MIFGSWSSHENRFVMTAPMIYYYYLWMKDGMLMYAVRYDHAPIWATFVIFVQAPWHVRDTKVPANTARALPGRNRMEQEWSLFHQFDRCIGLGQMVMIISWW
jgi:hypothetical protein